jgi:hypothetical protein
MRWSFLLALAACAPVDSPCEDAAAQLVGCSDDQRAAFVAACEQTGAADPAAFDGAACAPVPSDGKADAQTAALTGVCVAAMYGVKLTVTSLSPAGAPLSPQTKTALRPLYGALVDDVTVSMGAELPPRIVVAGHRLSVQPDAMTFGDRIFMLGEVGKDPTRLLLTTVHEMRHAQQAKTAGGFFFFAVDYCRDMVAASFDYDHIGLEVSAYAVEGAAAKSLQQCGKVTCP